MRAIESLCVLAVALLVSACNIVSVVPVVPIAPRGVPVRPEVAYGYEAYADTLSAWGTWEPDGEHGVRWCPRADVIEPGFTPYTSRGHWALSEAPIGQAQAGSPAWVSEDSDTWGAITTRHGWWVQRRQWCWIPGVEETPGRVVWRWGDGFVGWAPEAPCWVALDDVEYEALDWVFTLLGTLLEHNVDQNKLDGEARQTARQATAPARAPGGGPIKGQRKGPPAKSIGDARHALDRYAATHAVTLQQAAHLAAAQKGSSGSSGSSDSSGSKSSSSSKQQKKSDAGFTAGAYYEALRADRMMMDDSMLLLPRPASAAGPRGGDPIAAGSSPRGHANASALSHHAQSSPARGASGARLGAPSAAHAARSAAPSYRSSSGSSHKSSSKSSSSSRSSSRSSGRSKR